MKMLSPTQATRRTRILRLNILLGLVAVIFASFFMITGEYTSLADRKAADQVYNLIIVGGFLYMAITWFACVFTKPFWKPHKSESK